MLRRCTDSLQISKFRRIELRFLAADGTDQFTYRGKRYARLAVEVAGYLRAALGAGEPKFCHFAAMAAPMLHALVSFQLQGGAILNRSRSAA